MEDKVDREDLIREHKPDSQGWKNYVCFSTVTVGTGRMDFYAIPIGYTCGSNGGVVTDFDPASYKSRSLTTHGALKPFFSTTAIPQWATFAASGSSLFCIGGVVMLPEYNSKPSPIMYRLETTGSSTNKGGFSCSKIKMLSPRDRSSAIAMGGKLFIIGGFSNCHEVPCGGHWAEVFDPSSESSLPLPPPPRIDIEDKFDIVTAALHSSKQIFVASRHSNVAYLYDVVEGIWEPLDIGTNLSSFQVGQAAVVGKATLCWYQDGNQQLVAYDLHRKMWFYHPIRGLEKFGARCSRLSPCLSSLFPLDGDHLCLIWRDCFPLPRTQRPVFHFTKVRVSISLDARGKPIFDAFAVSSKSCVLKQNTSLCSGLTFPGEVGDGCIKDVNLCGPSWAPFQGSPQGGCGMGNSLERGETCRPRGGRGMWDWVKRRGSCEFIFKCNFCLEMGHLARDCPRSGRNACFSCGETGHMAKNCNKGRGGGGNVCFRGGEMGHMARYSFQVGRGRDGRHVSGSGRGCGGFGGYTNSEGGHFALASSSTG